MQWYLDVLKNYANFNGRARRKEYWMFYLGNLIVGLLFCLLAMVISEVFYFAYLIYALAMIIPSLAVCVRRLHDTDKEGVWILISFVPAVGGIWLLILMCTEGIRGDNRFGKDPKADEMLNVA